MRRLTVLAVLLALVGAPTADAGLRAYAASHADSLSLRNGTGTAVLYSRSGAVLGSLGRGTLTITDYAWGARTSVRVSGCERKYWVSSRTRVCKGSGISFSILGGAWKATVQGSRVYGSAVMSGSVALKGTSGTYSINHATPRRWPTYWRTFRLG